MRAQFRNTREKAVYHCSMCNEMFSGEHRCRKCGACGHTARRVTVCTDRVTICVNINCRHDGQEISFTI